MRDGDGVQQMGDGAGRVCVCACVRSAKYRPFSNSALESEERSFSILIFGARVSTPQEASCFLYLAALPAR